MKEVQREGGEAQEERSDTQQELSAAQQELSATQQELSATQQELSAAQQARLSMRRVTASSRISHRTNSAFRRHIFFIRHTLLILVTPAVTLFVTLGRHLSALIGVRR